MVTETSEFTFGPPIVSTTAVAPPEDRPVAVALILDVTANSVYGDKPVIGLLKQSLIDHLSKMESDNLFYFRCWHEDPGTAVAAVRTGQTEVRDLTQAVFDAVNAFAAIDRFYRRKLLLVTDQFMHRDTLALKKAVNQNAMRYLDIKFFAAGFGPMYSRSLEQCGWDCTHLDAPSDLNAVLTEVWK